MITNGANALRMQYAQMAYPKEFDFSKRIDLLKQITPPRNSNHLKQEVKLLRVFLNICMAEMYAEF